MSSAVKPFTVCSTLMESGVRGSKKRTSPLTLAQRKSQHGRPERRGEQAKGLPDADDVAVRLLLEVSLDHPGSVFPVGHHPTAQQTQAAQTDRSSSSSRAASVCFSSSDHQKLQSPAAHESKGFPTRENSTPPLKKYTDKEGSSRICKSADEEIGMES